MMDFLHALDAYREASVRLLHYPWLFLVGYHVRRKRRRWVPKLLMGHLDFTPPSLLLLPPQTVQKFPILPLEMKHVPFLLLEKQRVMSFSHFFADGARLVEGGVDQGVIIGAAGAATLPDKIETPSPRFTRVIGTRVSLFDLKTTI
ncbi:MAG: hypothetical protein Q9211_000008 [Gyalolechia sp. 1 TL-2023]